MANATASIDGPTARGAKLAHRARERLAAHPVAAIGALLALVAVVRCHHSWRLTYDDVYITYVYAESVARGEGLTWHGAEALGTSTPFLATLLGFLSRATGADVPLLGHLLSWASVWLGALALFAIARREGVPRAGVLAAAIWMLSHTVEAHAGSEYLPAVAAGVAAAWAFLAGRSVLAGALLALGFAFRAEAGLLAPLLAAALLWRGPAPAARTAVLRAAGVAMALTALWLALLWQLAGGQLVPQTLAAKRAQAESLFGYWPRRRRMAGPLFFYVTRFVVGSSPAPFFALALPGALAWCLRTPWPPMLTALVVWGPAHLLLVALLGVGFYPWYSIPVMFSATVVLGFAAELPARAGARWRPWLRAALAVVLAWVALQVRPVLDPRTRHAGDTRRFAYGRAAELFDRYPEGTSVAAFEVGFLGYATRQPVLDLMGLVTPQAPLAAVREARLDRARQALGPDLLMLPLNAGGLVASTVGDVDAFAREFALDRLQLDSRPPLALYRRAALAGRGEARVDLATPLAASGCAPRIVDRPGFLALALVVPRGASCGATLAPPAAGRLVFGASGAAGGEASLAVSLGGATGELPLPGAASRTPSHGWIWTDLPLPADAASARFACAAESADDCLVAYPHVAASAAAR
jgi:arabinofuranosyltransferase